MKKKIIIGVIIGIVSVIIIGIASFAIYFMINIGPVGKSEQVTFNIESGTSTNNIIKNLKNNDLIKDEFIAKVYLFLHKGTTFQAGKYQLNKNMSLEEIFLKFVNGNVIDDSIEVTFVEGKRLTDYAKTIANAFNLEEKDVLNQLKDKEFLNELISNNWFITEEILNDKIYYPLEGYLYPDTYKFDKDATIKDVILKLVNALGNKLNTYKKEIEDSKYTTHQLLTMASLSELEAATEEDRLNVAGVFYNRLNVHMTLGSDVTTYYASHKTFQDPLTINDLNDCNAYNTRSTCLFGLPVGPIAMSSLSAIKAAIEPADNDYLYFVADKTKKVYFSKTMEEQAKVINDLKQANLWL